MFEFNIRPHKYIVINARDTEQCLSFFADVAYDARFGRYGRVIRDVDVSCYSDLAAEQTVLPDFGGACDSGHGCYCGILSHNHVVSNLAQVVDPGSFLDNG